ncbi:MAG: hypothetical protein EP330_01525 [Deltaproteobacteria bacterium]|nr:MAG: hypothetical protein EP330_01525 [Deltaproteobacteria bacterium]
MRLIALMVALAAPAHATEVVWLTVHDPSAELRVGSAAGAEGPPLAVDDLRYAATHDPEADEQALEALDAVLAEVRPFESRLDGELIIMRELEAPISAVRVLRDESDRERLFRALVYQGFAVNRFFDVELGEAPKAAPYRLDAESGAQVRPWVEALALEPERKLTPYEVAEAPARIAYSELQAVQAAALPALIVPPELPEDAVLVVDGRAVDTTASPTLRVVPGRHLVHVRRGEYVATRWDVRLGPAESADLEWVSGDVAFAAWQANLAAGKPTPPTPELAASVEALGGSVVVALQHGDRLLAYTLTPEATLPLELPRPQAARDDAPGRAVQAELSLGSGWVGSHDFYYQDYTAAPNSGATVNAASLGTSAALSLDTGPVRFVAGVDLLLPLGEHHAARYRDRFLRLRPTPFAGVGLAPIQVVAGYAFPYHPWVGGRLAFPLTGALELRAVGGGGIPAAYRREDGTTYRTRPLGSAWAGVGVRL